jgi:AbrB family looped-hinge helix DNA binding protein
MGESLTGVGGLLYYSYIAGKRRRRLILSRISAKGQITLPRKVRQALHLEPGDRVLFLVENETVTLQPLTAGSARALAGSLRQYAGARPGESTRSSVQKEVALAAAKEELEAIQRSWSACLHV